MDDFREWHVAEQHCHEASRAQGLRHVGDKTAASAVYAYGFYVAATTGCTTIGGNAPLQVPVFVKNDLCLSGNAAISEPGIGSGTLTVYIGGKYTATANPFVGTSIRKIGSFTAVGGCARQSSNVICSNSASSKVSARWCRRAACARRTPRRAAHACRCELGTGTRRPAPSDRSHSTTTRRGTQASAPSTSSRATRDRLSTAPS